MTEIQDLDTTTAEPFDMWAVNVPAAELTAPAAELLTKAQEAEHNAQEADQEAAAWQRARDRHTASLAHLEADRRRAHRKATRKDRPNRHAAGREELRKINEERAPRLHAAIAECDENTDHHTRDAARLRAVADIYRTAAAAQTSPAQEAPAMPTTTTTTTAPTVAVTLPQPFTTYLDMLPMIENEAPEDDAEAAFLAAYHSAALVHNRRSTSQKITTSDPTVITELIRWADQCIEANECGDHDPAEYRAARQVAQRAHTALTKLRTALAAHKEAQQEAQAAQEAPQEAPAAAQGPQEAEQRPQAPQEAQEAAQAAQEAPAPVVARIEWVKTVRGHHNGNMTFPNGTSYRITQFEYADRARGHKGDHLTRINEEFKITWGLDNLAALCAEHAGYGGPVTIQQTGRERLTLRRRR